MNFIIKKILFFILTVLLADSSFAMSCHSLLNSQSTDESKLAVTHFIRGNATFPLVEEAGEYLLVGLVLSGKVSITDMKLAFNKNNKDSVDRATKAQNHLHKAFGVPLVSREKIQTLFSEKVLISFERTLNHTLLILSGRTSDFPDPNDNAKLLKELKSDGALLQTTLQVGEAILEALSDKLLLEDAAAYRERMLYFFHKRNKVGLEGVKKKIRNDVIVDVTYALGQIESFFPKTEVFMAWHVVRAVKSDLIGRNLNRISTKKQ